MEIFRVVISRSCADLEVSSAGFFECARGQPIALILPPPLPGLRFAAGGPRAHSSFDGREL